MRASSARFKTERTAAWFGSRFGSGMMPPAVVPTPITLTGIPPPCAMASDFATSPLHD